MEVRDYECDIEGIVNNANYLHYMEHTRHLFLKECGLSFAEMHNKGVDAVVARMNLQYKVPLQCDDEFLSRLWLEKQGVRYVFHQDIFRASDEKLCLKATVTPCFFAISFIRYTACFLYILHIFCQMTSVFICKHLMYFYFFHVLPASQ